MKTIDAKGKLCPMPLIMTKKALAGLGLNEEMIVLIDNDISVKNVSRFLNDHGIEVKTSKNGNIYEMLIRKTASIPESVKAEEYCVVEDSNLGNYVIAVQSNKLGDGAEELGTLLIKGFINTLPEITLKPKTMVFLNSGIFLSLKDSPVIEALKKLENAGVEILVCGTCLDYYQKKNDLGAGIVSNMYEILERLSQAGNVVYP